MFATGGVHISEMIIVTGFFELVGNGVLARIFKMPI